MEQYQTTKEGFSVIIPVFNIDAAAYSNIAYLPADNLYRSILYRVKFLPSGKNLTLIEEYTRFVFYEQSTANSQLAGMGLFIDNSLFNI